MSLEEEIIRQNPQWQGETRAADTVERSVEPRIRDELDEDIVTAITGMRRVGKTTLLKRIIDDIAARNDWFVSITESEDGIRFEVDNCLGVCEQSAPEPRVDQDLTDIGTVGTLEKAGYVEHDPVSSEWVVAGDGADIRGQDNDFKFVYTTVERPVRIEGRVVDIDHVADYSKSGFMIRDSLDEDATYAYAGATPRRGTELLWRTHRGTDGMSQTLEVDPFAVDWYRVDRVGDRLTAWLSTDGQTWEPVDERRIDIDDPVYVGLAVSSIVPGALAEATFRHVTVSTLDV